MNDTSNPQNAPDAKLEPPTGPTVSEIETLLRRIAPADCGSRPIYVALTSEMPPDLRPSGSVYGFHSVCLDLSFKSWLTDVGRWRGRGPAIGINDLEILREANELAGSDRELRDELYRGRMLAIALHEWSHALERPFDLRTLPNEIAAEIETDSKAAVLQWIADADRPYDPSAEVPPQWLGHEAQFIRILLHVAHRAERFVGRLPDRFLFSSLNYSLSGLWCYRAELRREIEAFDSSLCFDDLRKCHPPKSFIELWRDDLHRWWSWTGHEGGSLQIACALQPFVSVLATDRND
jgi:hypothetical protein